MLYCIIFINHNFTPKRLNRIGGVMVSVITSSAADRWFEPQSSQTKDYRIVASQLSMHAALRRKSKDWLARNQDNVSVWGDMAIRGLLFQ
jgi:hypothetical protein